MTDQPAQQPLQSPEAIFMEQQLRNHGKPDVPELKDELGRVQEELASIRQIFDTMGFPNGGDVALPYMAPEGGGGRSFNSAGGTVTINVFEDGVLTTKLVKGSNGSDFGPF